MNSLKEQGVPVYQYKAGDDAKRTEILNKLPNVRFQKAEQADREAKAEPAAAGQPGTGRRRLRPLIP